MGWGTWYSGMVANNTEKGIEMPYTTMQPRTIPPPHPLTHMWLPLMHTIIFPASPIMCKHAH